MKSVKRILALCLIISSIAVVLALSACNITGMISNDVESMMDGVLTSDDFTVEYKTENDVYTTLKICDGEMYYSMKNEIATDEYYLYCDEDNEKYYYAHEWKHDEKDKGIEKAEITKEQYIVTYIAKYNEYAHSEQVFNYRHVLQMAEPVAENRYEYSKEEYSENEFSRTEYSIEIKNDSLVLLSEHIQSLEQDEETEDGQTLKIITVKTTYSAFGDTEIDVPNKVLNAAAKGKYSDIFASDKIVENEDEDAKDEQEHVHTFGEWRTMKEASCAKEGEKVRTCSDCGERDIAPIEPTGVHEYRAWETVKEATCTEEGAKERKCFYCEDKETEAIPATGHKEVDVEYVAPDCMNDGCENGKQCETCGEITVSATVIPALGHKLTSYEAKAATCTEKGHVAYEDCSRCDYTTYEETEPIGHKYENSYECSNCGVAVATDTEGFVFEYIEETDSYAIVGFSKAASEVAIPHMHEGKPVTKICKNTFVENGYNVITLTISGNITGFEAILSSCINLEKIVVLESNTAYKTIDDILFTADGTVLVAAPNSKEGGYDRTAYTVPDGVISIAPYAFSGSRKLGKITFADSVVSVGEFAFYQCNHLTDVSMGNSLEVIENQAFMDCATLQNVTIPNTIKRVGIQAFAYCDNLNYNLYQEESLNGKGRYLGNKDNKYAVLVYAYESNGTFGGTLSPVHKDTLVIAGGAFSVNCTRVTHLKFEGDKVVSFGDEAFTSLNSLKEMIITESVEYIGKNAFEDCWNLTIYCEATEQPSTWDASWNSEGCTVYWYSASAPTDGGSYWHYVDGVATPW